MIHFEDLTSVIELYTYKLPTSANKKDSEYLYVSF